jgi:hypothetical protein
MEEGDADTVSESKEKLRKVVRGQKSGDNEDDIFVSVGQENTPRQRGQSSRSKNVTRLGRKKNAVVECTLRKEEIEDLVVNICQSIKPEESLVTAQALPATLENNYADSVDNSLAEEQDTCSNHEDDVPESDHSMFEESEESCESLTCWEDLAKKINENVEKKGDLLFHTHSGRLLLSSG